MSCFPLQLRRWPADAQRHPAHRRFAPSRRPYPEPPLPPNLLYTKPFPTLAAPPRFQDHSWLEICSPRSQSPWGTMQEGREETLVRSICAESPCSQWSRRPSWARRSAPGRSRAVPCPISRPRTRQAGRRPSSPSWDPKAPCWSSTVPRIGDRTAKPSSWSWNKI